MQQGSCFGTEMVVFYGSQTGNAMEIAKAINSEAVSHGLPSKLFAMNDFPLVHHPKTPFPPYPQLTNFLGPLTCFFFVIFSQENLPKVHLAIFVVSSTGDGDPPENCINFYNAIQRRSLPEKFLSSLQYTVLGQYHFLS